MNTHWRAIIDEYRLPEEECGIGYINLLQPDEKCCWLIWDGMAQSKDQIFRYDPNMQILCLHMQWCRETCPANLRFPMNWTDEKIGQYLCSNDWRYIPKKFRWNAIRETFVDVDKSDHGLAVLSLDQFDFN